MLTTIRYIDIIEFSKRSVHNLFNKFINIVQDDIMKQFSLNLSNIENTYKEYYKTITLASDIDVADGEIAIYQNFFTKAESDRFFQELLNNINWRQERIKMFGKEVELPRLTAWYGNENKVYKYSGISMNPNIWTPTLVTIKEKVEKVVKLNFNSVLVNLYRDGKDYVSWHSDDEIELGDNPTIASVSLGATRRFQLKHKSNKNLDKVEVMLTHGSLLIMKGTTQHFWKHQVPKTAKVLSERINLTFRIII